MVPSVNEVPFRGSRSYQMDPIEDPRWPRFVDRHINASVFHSVPWLRSLRDTHGYEPVVFTTSPPKEELRNGIVFCHVKSWLTGTRLVSLPFSDHCEPLCDSSHDLNCLVQHLQTEFGQHNYKYLQVRPVKECFGNTAAKNGWLLAENYYLHSLDLRPSLNELFAAFDKDSVRRRIQRAERAGLTEKSGRCEGLLKEFYTMFVLTRQRQGVPPTPYQWFRNLVRELGEALDIRIAYKEEVPIAAILTLRFKDTVYYKYGCSYVQYKAYGATPWLFWQTIKSAKSMGVTQFDLGRTEQSNSGLLAFKNHWGSSPQRIAYWQYPVAPRKNLAKNWIKKFGKSFCSLIPPRLLVVAGNLLYRHIG